MDPLNLLLTLALIVALGVPIILGLRDRAVTTVNPSRCTPPGRLIVDGVIMDPDRLDGAI